MIIDRDVMRRAMDTVLAISEADGAVSEARDRIPQSAEKSESKGRLVAMVQLAESLPGVSVAPGVFDADRPLNVQNGREATP